MTETALYEKLLGIERPWRVRDVRLALEQGDVEVGVEFAGETLACPACGAACPGYDRRLRVWRHLDTMQYRTLVRAEVPRVRCAEHGVEQVRVPWVEAQSRFTALFEAMVIDWLKVASFAAVARQCRLSCDQVTGIQERAVRRGLSRCPVAAAAAVGVVFERQEDLVHVEVLRAAESRGHRSTTLPRASCNRASVPALCMGRCGARSSFLKRK
ncbi:MAG: transposase family protein [Acidobacteria bacterium]|nr:transposase family protein [Acidobacteriota bacterium]